MTWEIRIFHLVLQLLGLKFWSRVEFFLLYRKKQTPNVVCEQSTKFLIFLMAWDKLENIGWKGQQAVSLHFAHVSPLRRSLQKNTVWLGVKAYKKNFAKPGKWTVTWEIFHSVDQNMIDWNSGVEQSKTNLAKILDVNMNRKPKDKVQLSCWIIHFIQNRHWASHVSKNATLQVNVKLV